MTEDPVSSIAVLGTGSAGTRHLAAIQKISSVSAWAIPIRQGRDAEIANPGVRTCPDIETAASQGVRAMVIATDTARHVDDALRAIAAGMHVLVEKPLGVTANDAKRLQAAVAQYPRVYVAFVLRFSTSLQVFREWLSRAGRLHSIRIECRSYLPDWRTDRPYRETYSARRDEGGVLRDLIHEIDYAGWIFGWPSSLEARLRNLGRLEIETEEIAELSWETPEAACLTIGLDYLSRPPRRSIQAFGENGTVVWNGISQIVSWSPATGGSLEEKNFAQSIDDMFVDQARAFLQACGKNGVSSPLADLHSGIKSLAVCDAAREASENRCEKVIRYA